MPATKEVEIRKPRLYRGDYSDKQLIIWLNELVNALEQPEMLEMTAENYRQSLQDTEKKLNKLSVFRQQSIYNEARDPIQHQ